MKNYKRCKICNKIKKDFLSYSHSCRECNNHKRKLWNREVKNENKELFKIKLSKCKKCKKIKTLSEFNISVARPKKPLLYCKECAESFKKKRCLKCNEYKYRDNFISHKKFCETCIEEEICLKKKYLFKCIHCKEIKLLQEHSSTLDVDICKICDSKRRVKYGKNFTPEYKLFRKAKERAITKNIPFTINVSDIIIPKYCPILGIEIKSSKKKVSNNSPTLDRVIPELGYVKGNVNVISYKANIIKNCGTAEEHEKIAKWIRENTKK